MKRENIKFSIRMNENLKIRVELLAKKNHISFTKMLDYLVELGYQSYLKRFDNYFNIENKKIEREVMKDE